jgi:hypothetical protein
MKAVALVPILAFALSAYGPGMLNIEIPTPHLEQGSLQFRINHRFYGSALKDEPFENFFGMDNGANVGVDLGWFPIDGLELRGGHIRSGREYNIGGFWNAPIDRFQGMFSIGYSSVKPAANQDREGGVTLLGSFSAPFSNGRIIPTVNYSFDGRTERHGPGFGLSVDVTEKTALIGEFFPVVSRDDENHSILSEDAFALGIRHSTWGHQFVVCFSNSSGIGPRGQLHGAPDNDLSIGFNIKRLF